MEKDVFLGLERLEEAEQTDEQELARERMVEQGEAEGGGQD